MSSSLESALERVHGRIADACARSGRDPAGVRLIAVSKTFAAERVLEALECGQSLFGENRVQEALDKMERVGRGATWHLVGSLQRNKARHAVGRFDLIHSVDDERLAREIDKRAAAAGLRQRVLLQLNLSGEQTKHGVGEGDLDRLADIVAELPHVELAGLMTVPPPVDDAEDSRRWFARLAELSRRTGERLGRELPELSMGMTDDFEVAVGEGATLVRVGRAIFGSRQSTS